MDYRLLCFASAVSISFIISSGETTVNMCQNGTTRINDANLELDALGPTISPPTTNTSMTCSCSINVTYSSNIVSVLFARKTKPGTGCSRNVYDTAKLDIMDYYTSSQSKTLQKDDLSNFKNEYYYGYTLEISITITSICGSNYTIQLDEVGPFSIKFSHVTCSNPETVVTSSSTTPSSTSPRPAVSSMTNMESVYSSKESSSASSVAKMNVSPPSKTGLIVGVVVGVGGGLLLLGAIILAVLIYRRRRAKPQSLSNSNQNAPTENSYEPTVEYASVSYEELRHSTLYDNQAATTDSLDTESGQNYYNLQGNVNSSFHHSDAVPISDQTTTSEVDNFVREPHLINDTDTTVIENDLYEK